MSVKCIFLVIVPLVLVYKFFPDVFDKIVCDSVSTILSSRIDHRKGEKSENEINWIALYIILLITFIITIILCVLLKRRNCGLYLFYTWIVTCVIVEVALSIYISYNYEKVKIFIVHWLRDSFDNYSKPDYKIVKILWDDIQTLLKCCGFDGLGDWLIHKEYLIKTYKSELPNSCCETQIPCLKEKLYYRQSYKDHCSYKLNRYFEENAILIVWTFGGLAVVKIAAVLLSNYYFVQLERLFQMSSTKLSNKINRTWSSKKSSIDIPLEKA